MKKREKTRQKRWTVNVPRMLQRVFCRTHTTKEGTDSYIWQRSIAERRRDERAAEWRTSGDKKKWPVWPSPCERGIFQRPPFNLSRPSWKSRRKRLNRQLIIIERLIDPSYFDSTDSFAYIVNSIVYSDLKLFRISSERIRIKVKSFFSLKRCTAERSERFVQIFQTDFPLNDLCCVN